MNTGKPTKTLADYLVIAVSPVLIMVLVHSLCFFLVQVFYRGAAVGSVRWVLFWFVLAVVLIARIGIEQGDAYAMGYGLALAGVTWLYLAKVQSSVLLGAILLGVVWFAAHKLTCNCTLIDDDADASGQGLLQSAWRRRLVAKSGRDTPVARKNKQRTFWQGLWFWRRGVASASGDEGVAATKPPGIWLIYFSLASLPIFGLGQTLLSANDLAARHRCFAYLFLYLAAALGLLMTTSFLGLRRYLRQRYLTMSDGIALGWVRLGVVVAVIVLGLSLLLPRPGAGEAWGALRYQVDYQLRRASEYAARFNPHGTGSGRAGNQTPAGGQPENQPAQPGQASNPNPEKNTGASEHGDQESRAVAKPGKSTGQEGNGKPGEPLPNLSPASRSIYPWLKMLFWLAAAVGFCWLLFRYRAVILTALRSVWTALRNLIAELFGWFRPAPQAPAVPSQAAGVPPFKMFKNPFLTGGDRVWSPERLIRYSYDALQSWALETEAERGSPQTPRELCRQLAAEMPEAAPALEHLAFLYGHVAYGASIPGNYDPEQLRLLWDCLSSPRPKPPQPDAEVFSANS